MSATPRDEQLWEPGAGPEANGTPLAEWWRRAAAVVIDTAVLWIPLMIATHSMERLARVAVGLVVGVVYFSLLNGSAKGQTLGKMVWQIRVRDAATGGPLGITKAAVRYIVPALSSVIPILGLFVGLTDGLWPLWDRRRQALHDKVAGSVVVAAR
jgi:uncharacterized RDD family membrane protein YckC